MIFPPPYNKTPGIVSYTVHAVTPPLLYSIRTITLTFVGVMGCGAAEETGLGFVCFVVINSCVLLANRVDFGLFFCSNFSFPSPPDNPNPRDYSGYMGEITYEISTLPVDPNFDVLER